jgi:hypothetical protein
MLQLQEGESATASQKSPLMVAELVQHSLTLVLVQAQAS